MLDETSLVRSIRTWLSLHCWIRHIPFYWRLLDSCFGLFGCIPLWICLYRIAQLERL